MDTFIVVRYGEIWLKGNNRSFFERALAKNIIACLESSNHTHGAIIISSGRIIIPTLQNCCGLKRVSGISSFSFAICTKSTVEAIKEIIDKSFLHLIEEPFRISVQRLDKVGPSSQEIERAIGSFVSHKTNMKVNLKNPKTTIGIEWYSDKSYVFIEEEKGVGGLPLVREGKIALLLRNEKDLLAGRMLLKRGCLPDVVTHNQELYNLLQHWCPGMTLKTITEECLNDYEMIVTGDTNATENNVYLPLEGLENALHH